MDIKIQILGEYEDKEVGIDQHKNIYDRPKYTTAWNVVHEYRRIPKTKPPTSEEIMLLLENGSFRFGVDKDGKYWKRYLNYSWKEMIYEDYSKYGLTSTIIGLLSQTYWTRESNGTIIKRKCDIPLREEKRRKCDPNFYKLITPKKLIKRRKDVTKVFLK